MSIASSISPTKREDIAAFQFQSGFKGEVKVSQLTIQQIGWIAQYSDF